VFAGSPLCNIISLIGYVVLSGNIQVDKHAINFFTLNKYEHLITLKFIIKFFSRTETLLSILKKIPPTHAAKCITKSGLYFNLNSPSIQNPVALSSTSGTIPSTINVTKTTYFPSSGYIYHSNGTSVFGVIQYTGKTATSFTGCTRYSGSTTISSGAEIIPFQIT